MTHRRSPLSTVFTVTSMVAVVMTVNIWVFGVPWLIAVVIMICCLGAGIVVTGTALYVSDRRQIRKHRREISLDELMDRVDAVADRYHAENKQGQP